MKESAFLTASGHFLDAVKKRDGMAAELHARNPESYDHIDIEDAAAKRKEGTGRIEQVQDVLSAGSGRFPLKPDNAFRLTGLSHV